MNILSPRIHGYIDYVFVALSLLAPTIFGLTGVAASLCYIVAVAQALMSLLTAYPLGVARFIPFQVHGAIEAVAAVFLLCSPWLFNFSYLSTERDVFIGAGVLLAAIWLITDYKAEPVPTPHPRYTNERHTFP